MRARRFAALLVPVGVGGLAFAIYLRTLLPGVGWGDIARFQYVARIWGIPHRFGYPLYIAISRLFGYLPIGNLAYRINMMSAVFGALAAVVVYFVIMHLVNDWIAAASAALSFAFSRQLWKQAVVAEVYTLNAFLIGAVLLVLLAWHRTRKIGLLYLGIGLYGLSFGNHMTVITLVPAVVYLLLSTDYRMVLSPKTLAAMAGLIMFGAAQYLYVIIRAHQQPLLNELGPFSWRGWLHWMTRSRFPGQFFGYTLGDQVHRIRIYLERLEKQFFRWGYIGGWIGAWECLKTDPRSFVFLAFAALGICAFGMNYGGVTFPTYLIPSYLVFSVFLGCGLSAVRRWLTELLHDRSRPLAWSMIASVSTVILAMPLYPLSQNWIEVDQSDNTKFHDIAWGFVGQVEPDFVLVESKSHYDDLEAIRYVAWGEKQWFSARTVVPSGIDSWVGQRPIYCWYGDVDIDARYVQEPMPKLPGMARIVGVQ
jgi:hypothetical protein